MTSEYQVITLHLLAALVAGGSIGLERSFHARPAGFRTHALVCLASSLLMLITLYQTAWLPVVGQPGDAYRTDPTRMAQGIMTGIGFLGAGVIFKEGLSVRGLTTAASIWITAAIGVLFGIGFWWPATLATVLTLGVLTTFRWLETRIPTHVYASHHLRFERGSVMAEEQVRELLAGYGFDITSLAYRVTDDGQLFEYRMMIHTMDAANMARLSAALREMPQVRSFRISPSGD